MRNRTRLPLLLRAAILLAAAAVSLAAPARAQQTPPADLAATPAGTWRGTSLCTPGHPTCHDETVVYRIRPVAGHFEVNASKIVAGVEDPMGIITCDWTPATGAFLCPASYGTWSLTIRGNAMNGTLTVRNELWRRVAVTRSEG